jgi:hypothetical protein
MTEIDKTYIDQLDRARERVFRIIGKLGSSETPENRKHQLVYDLIEQAEDYDMIISYMVEEISSFFFEQSEAWQKSDEGLIYRDWMDEIEERRIGKLDTGPILNDFRIALDLKEPEPIPTLEDVRQRFTRFIGGA